MRALVSGGGTGGHVYPLLVVVEALTGEPGDVQVLYVGSPSGMEESIVARTGLAYRSVDCGPIRGTTPWALWQSVRRLWRGYVQAKALLSEWPADVVLTTGGYVSVPTSVAAWRKRIPVLVYLPDREPGWAVWLLSWLVERIAISFEEVRTAFPAACRHKVWVSGYPVRDALLKADRGAGYQTLGLDPALKTLLVLGGSRGARSINQALAASLPRLLAKYQVIHASGQLDWPDVVKSRDGLPEQLKARYRVYPYLHEELFAAMAVADVGLARAGAATTAEFPAAGLPSILVPYPYSGQHQELNADFMAAHGAAVRLDDADLGTQLEPTVVRLLDDDAALERMGKAARSLARPDAAHRLAGELRRLAQGLPPASDISDREGQRSGETAR
ncbi:MAG: UDP-N-acetylglucosamine--N-acetylmuramyl-(pentapeptide) pyrophosphoryl-undecaprenol N-acetylglucosamine transferase [Anaerolineae bacterium]|nr:UDP-N-acetylglucosamine--N-acetylmuramyl-(pentapeptide) pyrophosphoryl-undecaprenol N-acetylglucosamine transferase [Anaerolineae bacterium]